MLARRTTSITSGSAPSQNRTLASRLMRSWPDEVGETSGVSAILHPDVEEYVRQAGVVEVHRPVEHRRAAGLQMVCDDACLGVPDLPRREQGLLTVDALDGVDHSRALASACRLSAASSGASRSAGEMRKSMCWDPSPTSF